MGESLWAGGCREAAGGPAGGQASGTKSDFSLQHSRSPGSSLGVESPSPSVELSGGPPSYHRASGRVSPSWGARLGTPGLQLPYPPGAGTTTPRGAHQPPHITTVPGGRHSPKDELSHEYPQPGI